MLTDYHTYLGEWPFRSLSIGKHKDELLSAMEDCGIACAYVSSLNTWFSEYVHLENLRLLHELQGVPGLIPVPVADLRMKSVCMQWTEYEQFYGERLPAVRLAPSLFGYPLNEGLVREYLDQIQVNVVLIAIRIQDARQGLPGWKFQEVDITTVLHLAQQFPDVDYVINGAKGHELMKHLDLLSELKRVKVDLSFLDGDEVIENLIGKLGEERVVPGSAWPIHEMHASTLKYQLAHGIKPNLLSQFVHL